MSQRFVGINKERSASFCAKKKIMRENLMKEHNKIKSNELEKNRQMRNVSFQ